MKTQIIQDHNGIPTGVFIPIQEWKKLKEKYPNIEEDNLDFILSTDNQKTLDSRLKESNYRDIDEFLNSLEKEYEL